jgi:CRP-like cAMP-binding protein
VTDSTPALSPFGVKTWGFTIHDLPADTHALLQQRGSTRKYLRDEEVQRRTVVPANVSWLLEGRLRCEAVHADGSEQHGGWVMPQEVFAVNSVLLQAPSRFTMRVETAEARVLHFSREVLLDLMTTLPEFGVGVSVGLSRRLQQQHDMVKVVGQRNLQDKLRAVLSWWARHHGIAALDGSVELWVAQGELAVGAGASRQRVHMELQALRDLGEIDLAYRKVILRPAFFARLGIPVPERR